MSCACCKDIFESAIVDKQLDNFDAVISYTCKYNPQSRGDFYEEEVNSYIKAEINLNT